MTLFDLYGYQILYRRSAKEVHALLKSNDVVLSQKFPVFQGARDQFYRADHQHSDEPKLMMIPSPFAIYMLFFSLTRRMCALCSLEYLLLIIIALLRIMPASIKSQRLPALLCDNYPETLFYSFKQKTWEGRDSIIELRVWQ